jgi:hypothetical protein
MQIRNKVYYKLIKNILKDYNGQVFLIGGAVIDCMADKKPKDYDIISNDRKTLAIFLIEQKGFDYAYSSTTADTFINNIDKITLQILKTDSSKFDYTINKTRVCLKSDSIYNLDTLSLNSKKLIPTEYSFNNRSGAINCLLRLKKMESKGYTLPKETKESLKRVAKLSFFDKLLIFFKVSKMKNTNS